MNKMELQTIIDNKVNLLNSSNISFEEAEIIIQELIDLSRENNIIITTNNQKFEREEIIF